MVALPTPSEGLIAWFRIPMVTGLLAMDPHVDAPDHLSFFKHLIDQAMLNIDATRISVDQISHQLLIRRKAFFPKFYNQFFILFDKNNIANNILD